jgi:hypothetical protein
MSKPEQPSEEQNEFLSEAGGKERGIVAEFVAFMAENKAWWMTPILVVLGLVGLLLILGATPAGAFLYTLF